jgi:hypothetical protein
MDEVHFPRWRRRLVPHGRDQLADLAWVQTDERTIHSGRDVVITFPRT